MFHCPTDGRSRDTEFIADKAVSGVRWAAMRTLARFLPLAVASFVLAPSSQDLHNRYGEPDIERFIVRRGIVLIPQYGPDHLPCQALIEPPQSLIHKEKHPPLMSSDGVMEVLEEIAPATMRGNEIFNGISASGW